MVIKCEELKQKVHERTKKILEGYTCHNLIKGYNDFKHELISHYQSKLQKRLLQSSENCTELKELRDKNKQLRIEAYRRNFMKKIDTDQEKAKD